MEKSMVWSGRYECVFLGVFMNSSSDDSVKTSIQGILVLLKKARKKIETARKARVALAELVAKETRLNTAFKAAENSAKKASDAAFLAGHNTRAAASRADGDVRSILTCAEEAAFCAGISAGAASIAGNASSYAAHAATTGTYMHACAAESENDSAVEAAVDATHDAEEAVASVKNLVQSVSEHNGLNRENIESILDAKVSIMKKRRYAVKIARILEDPKNTSWDIADIAMTISQHSLDIAENSLDIAEVALDIAYKMSSSS